MKSEVAKELLRLDPQDRAELRRLAESSGSGSGTGSGSGSGEQLALSSVPSSDAAHERRWCSACDRATTHYTADHPRLDADDARTLLGMLRVKMILTPDEARAVGRLEELAR